MSLDPDARRKIAAKRANERVKLVFSTMNAFAIGIVGAAVIVRGISSPVSLLEPQRVIWFLAALALHIVAHFVVGLLRSEE